MEFHPFKKKRLNYLYIHLKILAYKAIIYVVYKEKNLEPIF